MDSASSVKVEITLEIQDSSSFVLPRRKRQYYNCEGRERLNGEWRYRSTHS
jgi:hypothetical protein